MTRLVAGLVLLLAGASVGFSADGESPTFTDPDKAGIDFQLQGEYLGEITGDEGKRPFGVQIIALGEGNFRGIGYEGGLPGAGWARGGNTHEADGRQEGDVLRFEVDDTRVEVKAGQITIFEGGREVGLLKKVARKSPTLEARPPEGAVVVFDGSSTDALEGGKIVDGKWLAATNVASRKKFGDHTLHIEFRTPFMPGARGQGRGNSGVYVQSRYEVQVLDSFGLEGKDNECGGIYSIAQPKVNMCLPPLAWQTYDIEFAAARYNDQGEKVKNGRITVRHNGVLIHQDLELPHGTPGRHPEGPGPEALFLQDHGNPVVFRNIWVVEK